MVRLSWAQDLLSDLLSGFKGTAGWISISPSFSLDWRWKTTGWNVPGIFRHFSDNLTFSPRGSSRLYDPPLTHVRTHALLCLSVPLRLVSFRWLCLPAPPQRVLSLLLNRRVSVWPWTPFLSCACCCRAGVLSGFPAAGGARLLSRRPSPGKVHFGAQPAITFPLPSARPPLQSHSPFPFCPPKMVCWFLSCPFCHVTLSASCFYLPVIFLQAGPQTRGVLGAGQFWYICFCCCCLTRKINLHFTVWSSFAVSWAVCRDAVEMRGKLSACWCFPGRKEAVSPRAHGFLGRQAAPVFSCCPLSAQHAPSEVYAGSRPVLFSAHQAGGRGMHLDFVRLQWLMALTMYFQDGAAISWDC